MALRLLLRQPPLQLRLLLDTRVTISGEDMISTSRHRSVPVTIFRILPRWPRWLRRRWASLAWVAWAWVVVWVAWGWHRWVCRWPCQLGIRRRIPVLLGVTVEPVDTQLLRHPIIVMLEWNIIMPVTAWRDIRWDRTARWGSLWLFFFCFFSSLNFHLKGFKRNEYSLNLRNE